MRISLVRTKRLANAWRRPTRPPGPACTAKHTERVQEMCAGSSVEDWARYGGGLVPADDGGGSVANVPARNGARSR
jgi:hypothetical protein